MEDTIFDGEPHPLSEKYGYIAHRIHGNLEESNLCQYVEKSLEKYCNYLYENDKERVLKYLMEVLMFQVFQSNTPEHYQVIFRPPYMVSALAQYATLCLKFERAKKDTLEVKNEPVV